MSAVAIGVGGVLGIGLISYFSDPIKDAKGDNHNPYISREH